MSQDFVVNNYKILILCIVLGYEYFVLRFLVFHLGFMCAISFELLFKM